MLIREITYTDYKGTERTEKHAFNLSKAELVEWITTSGDYTLDEKLKRLYDNRNGKEIMETFRDLIYRSYGRISLDGRRFEKSEEIKKDFMETEAYSQLFLEVVSDAGKAAEFVKGIIPDDVAVEVAKLMEENPDGIPDDLKDYVGTNITPIDAQNK